MPPRLHGYGSSRPGRPLARRGSGPHTEAPSHRQQAALSLAQFDKLSELEFSTEAADHNR